MDDDPWGKKCAGCSYTDASHFAESGENQQPNLTFKNIGYLRQVILFGDDTFFVPVKFHRSCSKKTRNIQASKGKLFRHRFIDFPISFHQDNLSQDLTSFNYL